MGEEGGAGREIIRIGKGASFCLVDNFQGQKFVKHCSGTENIFLETIL